MSSFFFFLGGGWRNSGYTFKWNYSVSLLLTLLRILLRNKWWHWKSASTSSTTGYSILKRPFEMQLCLGAANFCILVYSEYEKKRYYSRYSFQKCQKTNASHTSIFKRCHLWTGEEKLTSRARNAKREHPESSTQTVTATRERILTRGKTKRSPFSLWIIKLSLYSFLYRLSSTVLYEKNQRRSVQFSFP